MAYLFMRLYDSSFSHSRDMKKVQKRINGNHLGWLGSLRVNDNVTIR